MKVSGKPSIGVTQPNWVWDSGTWLCVTSVVNCGTGTAVGAWCKWSFMNQDARGVQWLRVQEAWKKSALVFTLLYLSTLVTSLILPLFFSHLFIVTQCFGTSLVTFSSGGPSLKCCLVTSAPNCVNTAPGILSCMQLCNFISRPLLCLGLKNLHIIKVLIKTKGVPSFNSLSLSFCVHL